MANAIELKRAMEKAEEYVGKIGAPQPHYRDGSVGRIHSLEVSTEINHQRSTGDTNYWKDVAFDGALERVIRAEFQALAHKALDLMKSDYSNARIAEKASLLAQLAEIEALENKPNA